MLETSIIIALTVLFIHVTFWEGMIFERIGYFLKEKLPDCIKKPLFDCPICMAPWHGSMILLIGDVMNVWSVYNWASWILILFTAGGINTFLIYIISYCKSNTKKKCNCERKERLGLINQNHAT